MGSPASPQWRRVRKLPVVVEARGPLLSPETIETDEGTLLARVGDYIIRGVRGEQYPIKPDVFAETYELI